ncbi:hypothetical protein NQ317_019669 [Molorchus minor]|uniref:Palmitoyltransferase n=1 Tax=Molorchus minor TaxID=1323400 RepID=A0ABQ9JJP8_9CUCU|nr:hypothetical protein NQ317_019669 [Molorchus minor]
MTIDFHYQLIDLWTSQSTSTDTRVNMAQERVTRKWEIFQGRNRFYCNGRLMTAPNSGVFVLTVFLITITSALFFIFDCKYLAENVTIAIPIIGGLLFLFTMSSLLRTSLSDPGIIPRATSEEAAYVEKQIEVTNSANSPTYRPPPRTKEVLVKGQTIKLKYCFTCKIFRPPRASHCSLCDNCVDRFDHHCPWVGNCVGRRNYRFFYMFIVSLAFLAVFIFACAVAHLILITKDNRQFLDAVKESPPSVIVAIICFFSVWSILGLAGFHTYLTTSNQTTNEDNGPQQVTMNSSEMPGIYRQTTETTESNAGSITHLVTSEQPLAIAPAVQLQRSLEDSQQYKSQPSLSHSPVYNNIIPSHQVPLGKSHSYADNLNSTIEKQIELKETNVNVADLHLDPVVLRENHILASISANNKFPDLKLDNDLTVQEKENSLLSASRLRLLQDTTMIESALDLDSLDDSSLGTNSQAGLMKVIV